MRPKCALTIIITVGLVGCERKELDQCRTDLAVANRRLDELQNGAPRQLAAAKALVARSEFQQAKVQFEQLQQKHPGTPEAAEAAAALTLLEPKILSQQDERDKAEASRAALEKKKTEEATKLMVEEKDAVRGISFFRHKDAAKFLNTRTDIQLYYSARKNRAENLFFRVQYVADEWLFIKRITIKADDQLLTIEPRSGSEFQTDNGDGKIWEWLSSGADDYRDQIDAIIRAKAVTLRFEGRQYVKDRELSVGERRRLAEVISAYRGMGGTWTGDGAWSQPTPPAAQSPARSTVRGKAVEEVFDMAIDDGVAYVVTLKSGKTVTGTLARYDDTWRVETGTSAFVSVPRTEVRSIALSPAEAVKRMKAAQEANRPSWDQPTVP